MDRVERAAHDPDATLPRCPGVRGVLTLHARDPTDGARRAPRRADAGAAPAGMRSGPPAGRPSAAPARPARPTRWPTRRRRAGPRSRPGAPQPGQRRDVHRRPHRRVGRRPARLRAIGRGVAQAAEPVDEAVAGRVRAGPDAPARHLVDVVEGHPAPVGDLLHEVGVDAVEHRGQLLALVVGEAAPQREHPGAAAVLDGAGDSPSRSSSSVTTTLPPSTPIEPVMVAGWATITSAGQAM